MFPGALRLAMEQVSPRCARAMLIGLRAFVLPRRLTWDRSRLWSTRVEAFVSKACRKVRCLAQAPLQRALHVSDGELLAAELALSQVEWACRLREAGIAAGTAASTENGLTADNPDFGQNE